MSVKTARAPARGFQAHAVLEPKAHYVMRIWAVTPVITTGLRLWGKLV